MIKKLFPCLFKKEELISPPNADSVTILKDLKTEWSDLEIEVFEAINYERIWLGHQLKELFLEPYLCTIAREHSRNMVISNKASHSDFPKRLLQAKTYCNSGFFGEVVAVGYNDANSVLKGFIYSEKHKEILLNNKATHLGISIETNYKGKRFFTILLSERKI